MAMCIGIMCVVDKAAGFGLCRRQSRLYCDKVELGKTSSLQRYSVGRVGGFTTEEQTLK